MQTMKTPPTPAAPAPIRAPGEFLAFALGAEEYAIPIQAVQELRSYEHVTALANAPDFIKGVVNLRGIVVPIIDLRLKFGLGGARYDQFTVVIVLNLGSRVVGMVVDGVSDVVKLAMGQIRPAPEMAAAQADYLAGIGTLERRMLILLDLERLMAALGMTAGTRLAA